jgi:hypothetical protein
MTETMRSLSSAGASGNLNAESSILPTQLEVRVYSSSKQNLKFEQLTITLMTVEYYTGETSYSTR